MLSSAVRFVPVATVDRQGVISLAHLFFRVHMYSLRSNHQNSSTETENDNPPFIFVVWYFLVHSSNTIFHMKILGDQIGFAQDSPRVGVVGAIRSRDLLHQELLLVLIVAGGIHT